MSLNLLTVSLLAEALGARYSRKPPRTRNTPPGGQSARTALLGRLIGNMRDDSFQPRRRLALAVLIGGHAPVATVERILHHVRSSEIVQKSADVTPCE